MERATLVETSSWVRDARLYDAVSSVVRDESYPSLDRRAGLRVLVSYAERFTVSQQGQAQNTSSPRRAEASATVTGSVALRPTVREDIRRELARLASDDRDPDVRWSAQRASESLGYKIAPSGKPAVNRKP